MSQNDFTIANQTFPNTRADINSALQALASTSSGASVPSTTFANQLWYDTSTNKLYIRNEDNDANILLLELDQTNDTVEYFSSDSIRTALLEYTDGTDALTIGSGGELTTASTLDVNGNELILDADADTSLTADTDDRIDFKVGGTDRAYITNNTIGGIINRQNANPLIINGDMAVAQRSTSATGIAYTTVDRFRTTRDGEFEELVVTNEQSTDAPDGFGNSYKITVSTPETTQAADEMLRLEQRLEGQDLQLLKKGTSDAQAVTLSFYVKGSVTGTYIVNIHDNDNSRIIAASYTINSANTWEKKVLSFAGDTTGTLDNDNERSLSLYWYFGAGTDWTSGTLQTSWATFTKANLAVGQTNILTTSSATWQITGVQLEVGEYTSTTLPPFQHESFGDNLGRCQRYYQRWDGDTGYNTGIVGVYNDTVTAIGVHTHIVPMRATATFSISAASDFDLEPFDAEPTQVSTFGTGNVYQQAIDATDPVARTRGFGAVICCDQSSGFFDFDAEL